MTDDDHGHDETPATGRSTAPQSDYSMRDVGIGFLVAIVGIAIAFGIPFVLA